MKKYIFIGLGIGLLVGICLYRRKGFDVKDSKISGRGLFAKKNYKKGDFVLTNFRKENNIASRYFEIDFSQSADSILINHSETPNVEIKFNAAKNQLESFATKDIKDGEEITSDYKVAIELIKSLGYEDPNWLWFKKRNN